MNGLNRSGRAVGRANCVMIADLGTASQPTKESSRQFHIIDVEKLRKQVVRTKQAGPWSAAKQLRPPMDRATWQVRCALPNSSTHLWTELLGKPKVGCHLAVSVHQWTELRGKSELGCQIAETANGLGYLACPEWAESANGLSYLAGPRWPAK